MILTQIIPLVIIHNLRLFLQDKLSWELIILYTIKSIEFTVVIVYIEGLDTVKQPLLSLQDASACVINTVSLVGAVAMSVDATIDFLSFLSLYPELAVLFAVYQWATTPSGNTIKRILFQVRTIEMVHFVAIIIRLSMPTIIGLVYSVFGQIQRLVTELLHKVIENGVSNLGTYGLDATKILETYGLDAANMSSLTITGVTIDLVFICGSLFGVFKVLEVLVKCACCMM